VFLNITQFTISVVQISESIT